LLLMDLTCFLHDGWEPDIRPASPRRDWMDETPDAFAYRCLPLNIANAHGWEIGAAINCAARWDGGIGVDAVEVWTEPGAPTHRGPVSLFGQGVLTFHVEGIMRTPPGWNLWVGGPPNSAKDGIAPLSGVIETDWSPFTFTMNWRFTRAGEWVTFDRGEAIAFFFPVQRGSVEAFAPRFAALNSDPDLARQFADWNASRTQFHRQMADAPPSEASGTWQKFYYRGINAAGCKGAVDHRTKLRVRAFSSGAVQVVEAGRPDPAAPLEFPQPSEEHG
jgi:hypothetical protein